MQISKLRIFYPTLTLIFASIVMPSISEPSPWTLDIDSNIKIIPPLKYPRAIIASPSYSSKFTPSTSILTLKSDLNNLYLPLDIKHVKIIPKTDTTLLKYLFVDSSGSTYTSTTTEIAQGNILKINSTPLNNLLDLNKDQFSLLQLVDFNYNIDTLTLQYTYKSSKSKFYSQFIIETSLRDGKFESPKLIEQSDILKNIENSSQQLNLNYFNQKLVLNSKKLSDGKIVSYFYYQPKTIYYLKRYLSRPLSLRLSGIFEGNIAPNWFALKTPNSESWKQYTLNQKKLGKIMDVNVEFKDQKYVFLLAVIENDEEEKATKEIISIYEIEDSTSSTATPNNIKLVQKVQVENLKIANLKFYEAGVPKKQLYLRITLVNNNLDLINSNIYEIDHKFTKSTVENSPPLENILESNVLNKRIEKYNIWNGKGGKALNLNITIGTPLDMITQNFGNSDSQENILHEYVTIQNGAILNNTLAFNAKSFIIHNEILAFIDNFDVFRVVDIDKLNDQSKIILSLQNTKNIIKNIKYSNLFTISLPFSNIVNNSPPTLFNSPSTLDTPDNVLFKFLVKEPQMKFQRVQVNQKSGIVSLPTLNNIPNLSSRIFPTKFYSASTPISLPTTASSPLSYVTTDTSLELAPLKKITLRIQNSNQGIPIESSSRLYSLDDYHLHIKSSETLMSLTLYDQNLSQLNDMISFPIAGDNELIIKKYGKKKFGLFYNKKNTFKVSNIILVVGQCILRITYENFSSPKFLEFVFTQNSQNQNVITMLYFTVVDNFTPKFFENGNCLNNNIIKKLRIQNLGKQGEFSGVSTGRSSTNVLFQKKQNLSVFYRLYKRYFKVSSTDPKTSTITGFVSSKDFFPTNSGTLGSDSLMKIQETDLFHTLMIVGNILVYRTSLDVNRVVIYDPGVNKLKEMWVDLICFSNVSIKSKYFALVWQRMDNTITLNVETTQIDTSKDIFVTVLDNRGWMARKNAIVNDINWNLILFTFKLPKLDFQGQIASPTILKNVFSLMIEDDGDGDDESTLEIGYFGRESAFKIRIGLNPKNRFLVSDGESSEVQGGSKPTKANSKLLIRGFRLEKVEDFIKKPNPNIAPNSTPPVIPLQYTYSILDQYYSQLPMKVNLSPTKGTLTPQNEIIVKLTDLISVPSSISVSFNEPDKYPWLKLKNFADLQTPLNISTFKQDQPINSFKTSNGITIGLSSQVNQETVLVIFDQNMVQLKSQTLIDYNCISWDFRHISENSLIVLSGLCKKVDSDTGFDITIFRISTSKFDLQIYGTNEVCKLSKPILNEESQSYDISLVGKLKLMENSPNFDIDFFAIKIIDLDDKSIFESFVCLKNIKTPILIASQGKD